MKRFKKAITLFATLALCVSALGGCGTDNGGNKPKEDGGIVDLTGQTNLASSVTYSNDVANGVQAYYGSTGEYERNEYIVKNKVSAFSHVLKDGGKTVGYFCNSESGVYLENTMDVYILNGGERIYAKKSPTDGRINTVDLGYYYYSVNVRDLTFEGIPCYLEKIYHTYSDKVNEQFRIVSEGMTDENEAIGFEVKINRATVSKLEISDGTTVTSDIGGFNSESVEYVAFDIKGAGVIGFIFGGENEKVTVEQTDKYIVLRQEASLGDNGLKMNEDFTFGNRIYNDETHSFDGIRKEAVTELNPLSANNIKVKDEDGAKYVGYDRLKGCYEFYLNGEGFNSAYYKQPDKKFLEKIEITGDGYDRKLYVYVHTDFPLEGASVLDENDVLIPLPVQVSKNFGHEKEEPVYDPADKIYGDSYLPIVVEKNSAKKFTVVNAYMNWGLYPLKQLSSISYYVSYYHLSTGVTETNCIAPYYAIKGPSLNYGSFGKSWFLPDFRGRSGDMWTDGDPQFNSAGMLMSVNSDYGDILCDYTGSDISSSGLTYADLDYSFISNDGAYEYTMRHVEMPQTDETRTYYTISVKFLKDVTYEKGSFSLASFNGRNSTYKYSAYIDENGAEKVVNCVGSSATEPVIYTLNKDSSYFTLYGINERGVETANFGCIVKNFNVTVGGKESDVKPAYLNDWQGNLDYASLTLSKDVSFKAGDTINTDVIFLSYGTVGQENYDNVKKVYADSVTNPVTLTAMNGEAVKDGYVPTVKAVNDKATFAVSGGVSAGNSVNYAVKISGVSKLGKPKIYEYVNGEWKEYVYSSADGFDGYSVINENGKLTYSFVFAQTEAGRMFRFEI